MTARVIDLTTRQPIDTDSTMEDEVPPTLSWADALEGARDHLQCVADALAEGDAAGAREALERADGLVGAVLSVLEAQAAREVQEAACRCRAKGSRRHG